MASLKEDLDIGNGTLCIDLEPRGLIRAQRVAQGADGAKA